MNKLRKSVAFAMVLLLGMQSVIVPGYALEGGQAVVEDQSTATIYEEVEQSQVLYSAF